MFKHACETQLFVMLDATIIAVFYDEESLGHKWVKGQIKRLMGNCNALPCVVIIIGFQLSSILLPLTQPTIIKENLVKQTAELM